jgi:hypothetical protein
MATSNTTLLLTLLMAVPVAAAVLLALLMCYALVPAPAKWLRPWLTYNHR